MVSNKKKAKKISLLRKISDTFNSHVSSENSICNERKIHNKSENPHHHRLAFDFLAGPGSSYGGIYIVPNLIDKHL